jgi:shikimate kinase
MTVVILFGASGSGKTTIDQAIDKLHHKEFDVFYFDQIGVPSAEHMIEKYGSVEGWQRAKTIEWLGELAAMITPGRSILFEGQTRLSYLIEAARAAGGFHYIPLLVDCDDRTRTSRLSDRNQPELADENMMKWALYLRIEARNNSCEILDATNLSLEDSISHVVDLLRGKSFFLPR